MTKNKHHVREVAKTRHTDIFLRLGWAAPKGVGWPLATNLESF
jgi:hypothetical protein